MVQRDILPPVTEDDRMLSGLVYPLWPFLAPIILYGSKKEEPYLHFNALQAVALGAISAIASFIVFLVTWLIMYLLPGSFTTISGLMGLGIFGLIVFGILFYLTFILFVAWRSANGTFLRLPFIGTWAEKRMQETLNITPESYSTEIFGQRTRNRKLSNFDYRNAPGYVEEDDEDLTQTSEPSDEDFYNPDTDTYEYVSPDTSAEDILSYRQPDSREVNTGVKDNKISSSKSDFIQHIPGSQASKTSNDGFKPMATKFTSKLPGSSSSDFGAKTTIDNGGFKPLAPQAGNRYTGASVVAGQQRYGDGQFKPLVPSSGIKSPDSVRQAPKFQWGNDFSQDSQNNGRENVSSKANEGENNFKPGLMNKPRPSAPSAKSGFKWNDLGNK